MKYFIKKPLAVHMKVTYYISNDYAEWLYQLAADSRYIGYHEIEDAFKIGREVTAGTGPTITLWGEPMSDKLLFKGILAGTIIDETGHYKVESDA